MCVTLALQRWTAPPIFRVSSSSALWVAEVARERLIAAGPSNYMFRGNQRAMSVLIFFEQNPDLRNPAAETLGVEQCGAVSYVFCPTSNLLRLLKKLHRRESCLCEEVPY